jgi:hypothetical protein
MYCPSLPDAPTIQTLSFDIASPPLCMLSCVSRLKGANNKIEDKCPGLTQALILSARPTRPINFSQYLVIHDPVRLFNFSEPLADRMALVETSNPRHFSLEKVIFSESLQTNNY